MGNIIGGLLGGGQGNQFKAQSAPLVTPATADQANTQYQQAQQGIANQAALLAALQGQNGLQNQSSVFNQLQNVATGQGPNPAQAMLANATGANTANQAALMAGQRGAGANPGLIARQAAQQGAANQQNAAGQAAALQAQQSLGALGQLGGLANQQVANQMAGTGAFTGAAQQGQQALNSQINAQNTANVQNVSQQNQANADVQKAIAGQQGNLLGNLMGGLGTALTGPIGGAITSGLGSLFGSSPIGNLTSSSGYTQQPLENANPYQMAAAEGGVVGEANNPKLQQAHMSPRSKVGMHFHGIRQPYAHGGATGKVPALVSPGERYLPPKEVKKVIDGKKSPMKAGEKIPGKAKVKGAVNSYANDTVKKNLDEGGLVLPRSVTQSKNPHWAAHKFVSDLIAQGKLK